jgi:hypothetical protein
MDLLAKLWTKVVGCAHRQCGSQAQCGGDAEISHVLYCMYMS